MVKFKDGTSWTAEKKRLLVEKVLTNSGEFGMTTLFDLLRPDFNNIGAGSIQAAYYDTLKREPDAVAEVMEELKAKGIKFKDPYGGYNRKVFPKARAIVTDLAQVPTVVQHASPTEDDVLASVANLVDSLTKLNDQNIAPFISGLASLASKAIRPDVSTELADKDQVINNLDGMCQELRSKNTILTRDVDILRAEMERLAKENAKLKEDLDSVSFVVDNFLKLNTAQKIANLGDITKELKTTVDKYGMVVKVEKV